MQPILIVDDDTELCEMLAEYLQPEGFAPTLVHNGKTGAELALSGDFQAVVLDVMLPGLNGFEALKKIRRRDSRIPVIMLTAKGDDVDRILGLEMGADDYLPKPFNPRELVARLRAILRRGLAEEEETEIHCGRLAVFPGARRAMLEGRELDLTSTEYTILEILAKSAGTVVSKEALYQEALGRPLSPYDRSLDMHISHLRRKCGGSDGESPIRTVRGTGYQLVK